MRLPRNVVPLAYEPQLTIDPNAETFGGAVAIKVRVAKPTDLVWLNAVELTIDEARAVLPGPNVEGLTATVVPGNDSVIGLKFGEPLPAGEATLRIRYTGSFQTTSVNGAFKQKDRDDWYVFTHFEPLDARRAFPSPACFDYGTGSKRHRQCALIRDSVQSVPLDVAACPQWVIANRDGAGYYLPRLSPTLLAALPQAERAFPTRDLASLISDTNTLARAGAIAYPGALQLGARHANASEPRIAQEAINVVADLPAELVAPVNATNFAA